MGLHSRGVKSQPLSWWHSTTGAWIRQSSEGGDRKTLVINLVISLAWARSLKIIIKYILLTEHMNRVCTSQQNLNWMRAQVLMGKALNRFGENIFTDKPSSYGAPP